MKCHVMLFKLEMIVLSNNNTDSFLEAEYSEDFLKTQPVLFLAYS